MIPFEILERGASSRGWGGDGGEGVAGDLGESSRIVPVVLRIYE
jgi:hypothetical protein